MVSFACLLTQENILLKGFEELQIELILLGDKRYLATLQVALPLVDGIKKRHSEDPELMKIKKGVKEENIKDFHLKEGVLWFKGRLCVPNVAELKKEVMKEVHNPTFTTYPGSTKMYYDLQTCFWWIGMKNRCARFCGQILDLTKSKNEALETIPLT